MSEVKFAWHIHDRELVEVLLEPIEVRRRYIRQEKPKQERELRLRLLREVQGQLPAAVIAAGEAYYRAWEVYLRARKAYDRALADNREAIEALHAQECPGCPWDGHTIFPEVQAQP